MLLHPGLGKNARTFKKVKIFLRITKFKDINLNFKEFLRLCKQRFLDESVKEMTILDIQHGISQTLPVNS